MSQVSGSTRTQYGNSAGGRTKGSCHDITLDRRCVKLAPLEHTGRRCGLHGLPTVLRLDVSLAAPNLLAIQRVSNHDISIFRSRGTENLPFLTLSGNFFGK